MRVLVTGGAGYIGSVVVEELQAAGAERIVVLDDLSKGHRGAVPPGALLVEGSIADRRLVAETCRAERVDAAIHLAASSLVPESVRDPARYYDHNVAASLALLDGLRAAGVARFVLSSTAAVYGEPDASPITEDFPTRPTNPYGETKRVLEAALGWYAAPYGLSFASLRYFNAAGATERNGEDHDPETHLIPLVLAAARGERGEVAIFGDDYPTPDGTCVRDYIHVSDLAAAHVLALRALPAATAGAPGSGRVYNLGTGAGYSVREVISTAEAVTGRRVPARIAPRRPGDPAVLVASSERIRRELGWQPRKQDLRVIVADAWRWLETHGRY
ncbi:MAG TPA: UDP-glucose 4-epimerase GalE [Vicinamibacteria bacterium]